MELTLSIGQQNSKDWVDYFAALSPFIIGLITIFYTHINIKDTKKQIKQQREQWLNDALIQNEYNVLLNLKKILSESTTAIRWYFTFVLSDFVYDNDFTDDEILPPNDFIKQLKIYQIQLLKLYNFYRENYYIIEKYNIAKELKIIQFALHMSKIIDEQEYLYVTPEIIEREFEGNKFNYHRYEFMESVISLFKDWIVENRPDLLNVKSTCTKNCKNYCDNCTVEELALNEMSEELYWLVYKLNKLTVYSNDRSFDFDKEKHKIWNFEPYTKLKNNKKDKKRPKNF